MGNRNYCQELCSSFILTLFPHFPCASPVWGCSSSWTVPACVPAARCSPSLTACSRVVSLQSHKSWQQTCCSMDSSLHRVTGAAGSLFQGFPWSHCLLRAPTCSGLKPSMGLRMDLSSTMNLHGLWGNPCSGTWSTSFSSFSTDLYVCRALSPSYLALLS